MHYFDARIVLMSISICIGVYLFFVKNTKDDLKEPDSRAYFRKRLESPKFTELYWSSVKRTGLAIDRLVGSRKTVPSLIWFLCFGFVMSSYSFFYLWCINGDGSFGTVKLLPDTHVFVRSAAALALTAHIAIYLYIALSFWNLVYALERVRKKIEELAGHLPDPDSLPLPSPLVILLFFQVAFGASSIGLIIYPVTEYPILIIGFIISSIFMMFMSGLVASIRRDSISHLQIAKIGAIAAIIWLLLQTFAFSLIITVSEANIPYVSAFLFLGGLFPIAIALTSFISWALSSLLVQCLKRDIGAWSLLAQIAGTGLAAVVSVHLVAVAIVLSVGALNHMFVLQRSSAPLEFLLPTLNEGPSIAGAMPAWLVVPFFLALVPFAIHLIMLIGGAITLAVPLRVKSLILGRLQGDVPSAHLTLPAVLIAAIPWVSSLLLFGFVVGVFAIADLSLVHVLNSVVATTHLSQGVFKRFPLLTATICFLLFSVLLRYTSRSIVEQQSEATNSNVAVAPQVFERQPPLVQSTRKGSKTNHPRRGLRKRKRKAE